ncbi:DNA ligase [Marinomonas gallaica]|uniref:DNA ligase n=1 Tax=Marinomonas gallaica TaxID=1806667 RepID=UPI00083398F5|nr:DNA ligase [Marinomonas gallaica]
MRLCLSAALCCLIGNSIAQPVQLATVYDGEHVESYLVSEKLDGIRAIWDGHQLTTRQGNLIMAPHWFINGWPELWMDGELWSGRQGFNAVQKTVLDQVPNESQWRQIRYMVFDAPNVEHTFAERYKIYLDAIESTQNEYLQPVTQHSITTSDELYRLLDEVVYQGGEGLMLHRKDASFKDGRSDALLKLKPYKDAEARVVAHVPGKGKYSGKMGAIVVELANGRQFRVGSGFNDQERSEPPAIGDYITFRYQGLTSTGLPRFASFIRVRRGPFEFRDPD